MQIYTLQNLRQNESVFKNSASVKAFVNLTIGFMTVDEKYITRCFELAEKGKGFVSPNPFVGTVIVKDEKVIAEGWHECFGEPHAEVNAFNNSKEDVTGATLYCNLEPCCHTKKQTPPCVPLIISKGIRKVVISNTDPNPLVNGKGIKLLQDAGIEVMSGILQDEGKDLNRFYFKFAEQNVPFITIKIAQSSDGFISKSKNEQTWLTGQESVKFVHRQRAWFDAVLVGANTIKVDDPQLTVRDVEGRNPVRIILDGSLSIPLNTKVLHTNENEKTWIITAENSDKEKIKQIKNLGAKLILLPAVKEGRIELKDILKSLAEEKITSLFIEGGQEIFNQFISQKLYDEVIVLKSPKILGSGVTGFNYEKNNWVEIKSTEKLGEDQKIVIKPTN